MTKKVNTMSDAFKTHLQEILNASETLGEGDILQPGFDFLKIQLQTYLQREGLTATTFTEAIKLARKSRQVETNDRFWSALEAFYLAVGDSIDQQTKAKRWLRFVNIIESLQGYNGSVVIDDKKIQTKRVKRLCLAYAIAWEHLHYIAGQEDDTPSALVLDAFSEVHYVYDTEDESVHSEDDPNPA